MASLPYPRIHITNVRGHGIPPCPLCVFPPGGACSPHGMHGTHRSLGCVFSHRTHLGGYGIPAIPTPPSANPPTEFTEFTEISGARYSPTDCTDVHRLGGYGIPAIPTPLSANPPTEFTEFTEISGVEEPPTDFADAHRWLGCVRFCGFCGKIVWCLRGYGRMPYPPNLCTSVQSVGEYTQPENSVKSVNSVG